MTRLEAGAVRLKMEPCDVQDLVGCALAALEPRLGDREVDVRLPPDLPLVPHGHGADDPGAGQPAGQCLQIFSAGQRHRDRGRQADGGWLIIEVADRGPGVPEQDLKRVFDKFYRIPVPEGAGGTGLGLSICKGIVEAHGGRIRAENRDGGGLRIVIRLAAGSTEEDDT